LGREMTASWLLNIVGLLCITVGTLLILLYLWKSPRFSEEWLSADGKIAYSKHRRLLLISVGILAAWLVIQYLGIILL
jgi:hypothetical protein